MSDWKKDLQERFGDFREQEPEGLWSAIETEMASRKKRAVPLIWWASVPFAAALAALLILPGRGVFAPVSSSDEAYVEVVKDPGETPVSERMAEMLPAPESAPSAVPFVPSAVPSVSAASRTGVSTSAQASSEASPAQQAEERPVIEEAAGTPADPAPLSTDAAPAILEYFERSGIPESKMIDTDWYIEYCRNNGIDGNSVGIRTFNVSEYRANRILAIPEEEDPFT